MGLMREIEPSQMFKLYAEASNAYRGGSILMSETSGLAYPVCLAIMRICVEGDARTQS